MKRLHIHVAVNNLAESIRFYSSLFAHEPTLVKNDYAKWLLDDPRMHLAISTRGRKSGVDHLGIQVEDAEELQEMGARIESAALPATQETGAACCYSKSDKYWTLDPQGIAWETFHTLESVPIYGEDTQRSVNTASCCVSEATVAPAQLASAEQSGCGQAKAKCC